MATKPSIQQKIESTLEKMFRQHRVLFWYDDKREMESLFDSLELPGVEKITLRQNEFGIKYRILNQAPEQRFLLYQPLPKPEDHEDWLLDLYVANAEFHTEPASLYLQELDLPPEFKPLVQQHEAFFGSQERITKLRSLLESDDRETALRIKMLSVIVGCDPEWDKVLYTLFGESLEGKEEKLKTIEKFSLIGFLWESINTKYKYTSLKPTIKDFILHLVQDHFYRSTATGVPHLNKEAYLLVNRWKENLLYKDQFKAWSHQLETELGLENTIPAISPEVLLDSDTFTVIDRVIITTLRENILSQKGSDHEFQQWIQRRESKFFYSDYKNLYTALSKASSLLNEIRKVELKVDSPEDGLENYTRHWYKIDLLYRQYIYSSENAGHQGILKPLSSEIERIYSNTYLLKLGDHWQSALDKMSIWKIASIPKQNEFFSRWVSPYISSEKRVFVIISDALRFESAAELRQRIMLEDRYTAELTAVLGSIPSYTQLGMASLLPHSRLTFEEDNDTVFVDGISSQGTANRTKILQRHYAGSTAITAEEFLKLKANTEGREFIKPYNIIYIYSNHIDKIGDDKTSEGKVFDATEEEFQYLLKLVKHINNMNGYNMIVTADHGYIYQHQTLEETDFTDFSPTGKIMRKARRFVLGKDLSPHPSVKKWNGPDVGFGDDTEVLLPKSINRIRIQGAGSRFVHGGASLQEIVIPVLEINKARKSDVAKVEIDLIGLAGKITSNTFGLQFYQQEPISEKVMARQLRTGFYSVDNELISDSFMHNFNVRDADSRGREKRQLYQFSSKASSLNGQEVYLLMEEPIEGTNQFRLYKKIPFRMLIAFGSEFDEF